MTNYECIKAMNVEEIAKFINRCGDCETCCAIYQRAECNPLDCGDIRCNEGIAEWLNSEVEE